MLSNMANLQRVVISILLILTATFLFFAQSSEAAKGPKITHKVAHLALQAYDVPNVEIRIGILRHRAWRQTSGKNCDGALWQDRTQG